MVLSDEIHSDFIQPGYKYTCCLNAMPEGNNNCLVSFSATKTFNLAGLQNATMVIKDANLRKAYQDKLKENGVMGGNIFGVVATKAAYENGSAWVDELNKYIGKNYEYFKQQLNSEVPSAIISPLEGTYLAWVNLNNAVKDPKNATKDLLKQAKVWYNDGGDYGMKGTGYIRVNLASPKSMIEEATKRTIAWLKQNR
jgi:cystathionine beta-lyase